MPGPGTASTGTASVSRSRWRRTEPAGPSPSSRTASTIRPAESGPFSPTIPPRRTVPGFSRGPTSGIPRTSHGRPTRRIPPRSSGRANASSRRASAADSWCRRTATSGAPRSGTGTPSTSAPSPAIPPPARLSPLRRKACGDRRTAGCPGCSRRISAPTRSSGRTGSSSRSETARARRKASSGPTTTARSGAHATSPTRTGLSTSSSRGATAGYSPAARRAASDTR